jgi:hypothetical protein
VCRFDACQKVFEKKKMYMKHVYLVHEGGHEKQKLKKICDICGNLVTANNMKQHVRWVFKGQSRELSSVAGLGTDPQQKI